MSLNVFDPLARNLSYLYPVFVTAPVPSSFLDDFLARNAVNFPPFVYNTQNTGYSLELIPSRSKVQQQIAAHQATRPFIEGTKPPVLDDFDATGAANNGADSFIGASLDDIATFVTTNFSSVPDIMSSSFFVVIDADSLEDKSVVLAEIIDEDDVEEESDIFPFGFDEQSHEWKATPQWAAVLRRQKAMKRSKESQRVRLDTIRVGMAFCGQLQTFDNTSQNMEVLQLEASLDGVF